MVTRGLVSFQSTLIGNNRRGGGSGVRYRVLPDDSSAQVFFVFVLIFLKFMLCYYARGTLGSTTELLILMLTTQCWGGRPGQDNRDAVSTEGQRGGVAYLPGPPAPWVWSIWTPWSGSCSSKASRCPTCTLSMDTWTAFAVFLGGFLGWGEQKGK